MAMEMVIRLPAWAEALVDASNRAFTTHEARMQFVVRLARENVERGTGGPFGAAVFDDSGYLIAAGVNQVVAGQCSILHAEIVAIALAQRRLGRYDIGEGGTKPHDLVSSAEPCAMCLGAVPWSGVTRLVCGARDEDARRAGFDEGAKPDDWVKALETRGIAVVRDVLRPEAVAVLDLYVARGGQVYSPGAGRLPPSEPAALSRP